ncbi:site-specific DNA-methyltransferase [Streptococcus suis]|nr:site-specific DNA-methyltransferase [Streptococcus suis]
MAKIGQLFPEVLTESSDENGRLRPAIDFDKLRQFLSREIVEGREFYEFTWVGKRGAIAEAGKPTTQTLRPDLEESVDFDKSENIFITGDNLEVLKVLQESYLGKIDMIYIDPPYNTGKDFVYSDKFQMSEEELADEMDLRDEDGLQRVGLTKNEKSSARYHSDWLNMMYPRLVLARNLLKDSGVIFISIDDNEQANLKAICDEIFGEENFVADVIIDATPKNDPLLIATSHEYVLTYVKDRGCAKEKVWGYKHPLNDELNKLIAGKSSDEAMNLLKQYYIKNNLTKDNISNYKFVDEYGIFRTGPLDDPQSKGPKDARINLKTGNILKTPTRGWSCNIETWNKWVNENLIYFPSNDESLASKKTYLDSNKLETGRSVIKMQTRKSTNYLRDLFGKKGIFDNPKPIDLLKYFINLSTDKEMQILDFFAGSATTADAVMQLNAEDGGNRKYILCTLDEQVADKSAAKEAGYETIDQISRERIRRAAKKIQEEHPETVGQQDFGFRAYKLDSSNFKDVSQTPDSFSQESLFDSISNIKDGRTDLDLLFQIMLTWGMELSHPIAKTQIDGTDIYNVADGALIACFADEISESVLRQIAKEEPLRAVFKDESFANSAAKINLGQIFKEEAPNTKVKVV